MSRSPPMMRMGRCAMPREVMRDRHVIGRRLQLAVIRDIQPVRWIFSHRRNFRQRAIASWGGIGGGARCIRRCERPHESGIRRRDGRHLGAAGDLDTSVGWRWKVMKAEVGDWRSAEVAGCAGNRADRASRVPTAERAAVPASVYAAGSRAARPNRRTFRVSRSASAEAACYADPTSARRAEDSANPAESRRTRITAIPSTGSRTSRRTCGASPTDTDRYADSSWSDSQACRSRKFWRRKERRGAKDERAYNS